MSHHGESRYGHHYDSVHHSDNISFLIPYGVLFAHPLPLCISIIYGLVFAHLVSALTLILDNLPADRCC